MGVFGCRNFCAFMLILLKIFERSNAPTVEIKVSSISILKIVSQVSAATRKKWLMTYCDKINYKNHFPLHLYFLFVWSDWFLKANPCFHAFTSEVIFKRMN